MKEKLAELIKECEGIRGRWNGDTDGYEQEQAHIATDIIEKAEELIYLIDELNGTN